MKSLQSTLKFWQEIVFIIGLGILVFGMTMNAAVSFQQVFNIVFYCIFVSLLICLIGQFFWKNFVLALWLAVQLGFGSVWMILAALSDLAKMTPADDGYLYTVFGLFLFMGLTATAITMPFKYLKSDKEQKSPKIIGQMLSSLFFVLCFISCDRPACKNTNPIFDDYKPVSREYKLELIKQLSIVDQSKLRYWLKDYTEIENEVQLHFYVQSKELCAVLILNVEQWNKLERIKETKGRGRFNAEFTKVQFDIEQDSLNPKFLYRDFSRIID